MLSEFEPSPLCMKTAVRVPPFSSGRAATPRGSPRKLPDFLIISGAGQRSAMLGFQKNRRHGIEGATGRRGIPGLERGESSLWDV